MVFPTVQFGLFFLIVLGCAWPLCHHREWHKLFLLAASYFFYGFWNVNYVPLLFGISLFAALVAQRIQNADSPKVRKFWLVLGVVGCLATLVYYKYVSFLLVSFLDIWALVASRAGLTPSPPVSIEAAFLPLGVSFFVFHAISLLADVYRDKLKQTVRIHDVLLYVSFFPQLIAGPILRASQFMPQLLRERNPKAIRVNRALILIVLGLFKKVVIANTLGTQVADPVFNTPELYSGADMLLATYAYAVQIYCDFSGYTDIAIGCALLLGYRFPRNFHAPYTSASPQEFWRRWHISLSTWLRNYLYFPLGGSRTKPWRTNLNLMITMLLGGLWHGAAWTFVVWGALHGSYLVIHRLWARNKQPALVKFRQSTFWRWTSRFLLFHAVCFSWIFFRSTDFEVAFSALGRFTVGGAATLASASAFALLALGLAGQYVPGKWLNKLELGLCRCPTVLRGAALALAIFVIDLLGPTGVAPFIYFQF